MVKRFLRKIGYKIIESCIPEISILNKNINWNSYTDYSNSNIPETCKITSPYNIQDSELGEFTYIERNSFISETTMGKFCSVGPNLKCGWGIHPTNGISTSPMFYSTKKQNGVSFTDNDKIKERKRITVGSDVFIGMNVTILDGITIGDGAVIGAGSVVSKDIPPYAIAVGSPIKVIKYRFEKHQIEALLKIRWWDFPEEQLKDIEKMFFDIDAFIQKYEV